VILMPPAGLDMRMPTDDPNAGMDAGGEALVDPRVPRVDSKPGIQKSEGQLTVLYTLASIVLSYIGFKYSPDKIETAWGAIQTLIYVVGPMLLNVPILKNYINSRGIVTSNTVWANAGLQNPLVSKDGAASALAAHSLMQQGLLGGVGLDSILSTIGGGTGKKDPKTYIGLAKIIAGLAPGGSVIEKGIDKIGLGGSDPSKGAGVDPDEIRQAFTTVVQTISQQQSIILYLWNEGHPQLTTTRIEPIMAYIETHPVPQASASHLPVTPVPTRPQATSTIPPQPHSDK
jgi:hypothetical protein